MLHLRCDTLIDGKTFALPTTHHPLPGKNPTRFSDDGALRLAAAVRLKIQNDPVPHLIELMGAGGI